MRKPAVIMTRKKKTPGSSARRWHRGIGVGASLFVVFLVITGLILNHAHQLGLDQQHVSPRWLLRWYGMGDAEASRNFAADGQWLSFAGSQLYLDGKAVTTVTRGVGAVEYGDWLVAAGEKELLLLNRGGELIERLPWEFSGGAGIEAIGHDKNGALVVKSRGKAWVADGELLNWFEPTGLVPAVKWSSPEDAPAHLQQAIASHYRGKGPSLERLLLDLHSGRIFGRLGMLVYDLLALVLGFSALSGLVLWWRTRGNGKSNGRP